MQQTPLLSYSKKLPRPPHLQQSPPRSVSSHQHRGKTLHQHKDSNLLKLKWWLAFFSNKVFFKLRYVHFFWHSASTLNRLQYSVNITFICTGKPKKLCDSLYCNIHFIVVVWNQTRNISKVFLGFLIAYLPPTSVHVSLFLTKMPMSGGQGRK